MDGSNHRVKIDFTSSIRVILHALVVFRGPLRSVLQSAIVTVHMRSPNQHRVDERVREFGETVRRRIEPAFQRAGVPYPPAALALLTFKQDKRLEVYASGDANGGGFRYVRSYPVLAASGHPGPKFREGDQQVPEGLYRLESLNPNSRFHLALRVNYPNEFDRARAADEGRANLGGDIMIHGGAVSIGCLAMGDPAVEDLFVLAALIGVGHIRVVWSPVDFRREGLPPVKPGEPGWLPGLYEQIQGELKRYPLPPR